MQVSRAEKFTLALLTIHLKRAMGQTIQQLSDSLRIFRPETVLKWHRELVQRKWTHRYRACTGRPRTQPELEHLVLQLAQESDWGNGKNVGELLKLGYQLSDETIATILKRQYKGTHHIDVIRCRNALGIINDYYRDAA